ncbi:hypothetical protein U2I54_16155 [Bacillus pseudomycoides]|uniref:Phage protein n=1 Tax=Bacillus bingmayongensis TaxID=1150157 RepID=A0ABU5JYR3_9BACI|nr:hypothetical protein [Bacillus pseudomycoides]
MSIPKRLMIGSVPYDVEVVKGWIEEFENDDVVAGEARYFKQKIALSDQVEGIQAAQKVVLHEAVHAMLYEAGLNRLNKEQNVTALTSMFYDFIENNIRGGISSLVGTSTENVVKTVSKLDSLRVELDDSEVVKVKPETDKLSFINTAEELTTTLEKHKPKVNVSALGAAMAQAEVQKTVDPGKTRKLPIINENRGSFPMEDVVKITKKETADPIHWKTGIKHDDNGTPRYRTRYECSLCGNRGNQYEYEGNKFTKCHNCEAKLKMEPATKKGFPERDGFGNFFVASEEYSVILEGN